MKSILLIPALLIVCAGAAYALCRAVGFDLHPREMAAAATSGFIAGELALIPAILARNSSVIAVSQAGLAGTVIQMLISSMIAGIVMFENLVGNMTAFVNWSLLFTFASLAGVVVVMIQAVHTADAAAKLAADGRQLSTK